MSPGIVAVTARNRSLLLILRANVLAPLATCTMANMVRLLEVTLPSSADIQQLVGEEPGADTDVAKLRDEVCEAEFILVQSEFSARSVQALGVRPKRKSSSATSVSTRSIFNPGSVAGARARFEFFSWAVQAEERAFTIFWRPGEPSMRREPNF